MELSQEAEQANSSPKAGMEEVREATPHVPIWLDRGT